MVVARQLAGPWRLLALMAALCLAAYTLQNNSGGVCSLHTSAATLSHESATLQPSRAVQQGSAPLTCPSTQEVQASAWAKSCYLVTEVCVDRGMLVLYGDRYQPGNRGGNKEPPMYSAEENYGQFIYVYRNGNIKYGYPLDTIRSRVASISEGADYLQSPAFSNCTVPVVWYPFWMTNFGHFFRDNAAKLFGFIEDTPWGDSIKLVPMTAEGLALPGFNYDLLQPMSRFRVETWADFSSRLPPKSASLVQPKPSPNAKTEHQRCFQNMFICTHGLNITRWPLHGFGRHVVRAYRHLLPPEVQALGPTSSIVPPQPRSGSSSSQALAAATVLNVVFQKRAGDTRQLLNSEELLRRCNQWRYCTTAGRQLGAKCWEVEITDLVSGLTAAQLADVFVGIHGANLANGWLMRPGSSMVEVQLYGFDAHVPHLQDPLFNARDKDSRVLWWVLMGCDPTAWQPSPMEASGRGEESNWAKNRNMVLRWEALETALQQVAETGGDMQRYWQLWEKGEWWWHVGPQNITFGGHYKSKCSQQN